MAGCGTVKGTQSAQSAQTYRERLTASETAQGKKLLAQLTANITPGQTPLLSMFGVGNVYLGEIVPHQTYVVLQVTCEGTGTMTLTTVGAPTSSWPPPPHQEMSCSTGTSVAVTGSQNAQTVQASFGGEGSVWQDAEGSAFHLQVIASKTAVWAVRISSSKTSH